MSAEVDLVMLQPCAACAARLSEWTSGTTTILPPALLPLVARMAGVRTRRMTDQSRRCGEDLVRLLTALGDDLGARAGGSAELLVMRPCPDCASVVREYHGTTGAVAIACSAHALAGLAPLVSPDRPPLRRRDREAAGRIASAFRRAHALLQHEQRRARVGRLAAAQRAQVEAR